MLGRNALLHVTLGHPKQAGRLKTITKDQGSGEYDEDEKQIPHEEGMNGIHSFILCLLYIHSLRASGTMLGAKDTKSIWKPKGCS